MIKKFNSNKNKNNNKYRCECKIPKEYHLCQKVYVQNPSICIWENGKFSGSIIVDSVITHNEITQKLLQQKSLQ